MTVNRCLGCGRAVPRILRGDPHRPGCWWKERSLAYNAGLRARLASARARAAANRERGAAP